MAYTDSLLYVAISVVDPCVVIQTDRPSAQQDGVEIWLDARPDPLRAESKAWADNYQATFFLVRATPSPVAVPRPSVRVPLPANVGRAVHVTASGYDAEFAIPIEVLDRVQGGAWRELRLNVCITDFVAAGEPRTELWWQPAWRSMESRPGSGTFRRD